MYGILVQHLAEQDSGFWSTLQCQCMVNHLNFQAPLQPISIKIQNPLLIIQNVTSLRTFSLWFLERETFCDILLPVLESAKDTLNLT